MKSIWILTAILAGAWCLESTTYAALTRRDSEDFVGVLDPIEGDAFPSNLTSWDAQLGDPDGLTVLNGDGTLTLNTTSAFDRWWNRGVAASAAESALDASVGWTWEARIRVDAVGTNGSAFDIVTRDNTVNNAAPWIVFYQDGLGTRPPATTPNLVEEAGLFDDFQVVRMAYDGSINSASVYLNGQLLVSDIDYDSFAGDSTVFIGRSSGNTGTGTVTIDYIRFDTTGGYAPIPEPTSIALAGLAVVGVGVARRRYL